MPETQKLRRERESEEEAQRRQTAQSVLVNKLTSSGYTTDQALQILDIIQRMRRGENVRLTPEQSNWLNDINSLSSAWSTVSPSTRRISQLTVREATNIAAGLLLTGPERFVGPISREAVSPTRVKTYRYMVTVNGEDYQIQTNRELVSRGLTTIQASRIGQLRDMLVNNPTAVLGITRPDGTVLRPGTPAFDAFTRAYLLAYRDMIRNPDSDAIIIVAHR